jgi:DNA-damage-inducible protein J
MAMNKSETLHIRVEPYVKANVENTLDQLGLTTTEAINIFLKQILLTGGLPFEIKLPSFNAETEKALKESDDIIKGKVESNPQSVNSFFKEMGL